MKNRFIITLLLLLLLTPSALLAAEFDPNFLISDQEMQDPHTMNREDVQAFLDQKGGYISSLRFKDVEDNTRDVADIITRAAALHSINPKYLLVKLQKEQSLVTDKDPTQKQLDWATGYGICDACKMDDPKLLKHKGFGTQVDSAAAIIRWYYDNYKKETWIKNDSKTYTIDNQKVTPATLATGFLYTYTPHIHGNKNFWKLWQSWFDQVYPDGTLLKSTDDSTVFIIQDKKKRPFKNYSSLITRYSTNLVITVPPSEINRYVEGADISIQNFAVVTDGIEHYLIDGLTKRRFESYEAVKLFGYHPDEIKMVSDTTLLGYEVGEVIKREAIDPSGRLVEVNGIGSVYFLKDGKYQPIYDKRMIASALSNYTLESIDAADLAAYTPGTPVLLKDGTLFGIEGANKIYVIENNKKRHIASEEVFNGLGYKWENIIWVNQFAGEAHETAEPLYVKKENQAAPAKTPEVISSTKKTETKEVVTTPATSPVANLMVRTPAKDVHFTGPTFDTAVETYLIADAKTNTILAGKNINTVRPLASLTKVQTAKSALDHGLAMQQSTTYNPSRHKSEFHKYQIGAGDQVKNQDLLDAMLISSLNTPAHMLADSVAADEKQFMTLVNKDVQALGLKNTMLYNPTGTEVKNQTTAKEYLALFSNAIKNKTVLDTLGQTEYKYSKTKNLSGTRLNHWSTHSNDLALTAHNDYKVIASKTGYLYESGANLVMLVERTADKKQFIIITLGNVDFANRFVEPNKLTSWAMKNL